jgi:hypothetical protein
MLGSEQGNNRGGNDHELLKPARLLQHHNHASPVKREQLSQHTRHLLWITALVALRFVLHDATRSPSHGEGAVTHSHTLMDLSDDGHEGGAIAKPPKQEAKASLTTDTIELEAEATRSLPITLPMVKPWSPLIMLLLLP